MLKSLPEAAVVLRRDQQETQVLRVRRHVLRSGDRGLGALQGQAGIAVPDGEVVGAVVDGVDDDGVPHRSVGGVAVVPVGQRLPVDEAHRGGCQQTQVEVPVGLGQQRPVPVTDTVGHLAADELRDRRDVVGHHRVDEGPALLVLLQHPSASLDQPFLCDRLTDHVAARRHGAVLEVLLEVGHAGGQEAGLPGVVVVMDREELAGGDGQTILQGGLAPMRGLIGDHPGALPQPLGGTGQSALHGFGASGVIDDDELEVLEGLRPDRLECSVQQHGTVTGPGHHGDSWRLCGGSSHVRGSSLIRCVCSVLDGTAR